ncbi:MAG: low molecular weight phosphotyrosine protein phosphatase [Nocardioidaceae bacterium]|nr:low molecular weight phosphotyrosine protein phosphatase [Nocardioidaceae bacterium]
MTPQSAPAALPPPHRSGRPYSIALVCLGNICRSPTAEVVLTAKLAAAGLSDEVVVRSAGTGDWHIGERMHNISAATLTAAGYDATTHRAALFDVSWFDDHDLLLAMDSTNHADICTLASDDLMRDRVLMFRSFDALADGDLEVPDPWYGGAASFEGVLAIVERSADELVARLTQDLDLRGVTPQA